MKRIWSTKFILSLIILLMVSISACAPTRIPVEEVDEVPSGESELPGDDQESPLSTEEPDQDEAPKPVATTANVVPDDIPIIDGATQIQVIRGGTNIVFRFDGSIEDVVAFYQETLPEFGWELAGPPDNAIGSIATMYRENEIIDTLSVQMQANELGGFVNVIITISRVN